jgi:hypothetical protein
MEKINRLVRLSMVQGLVDKLNNSDDVKIERWEGKDKRVCLSKVQKSSIKTTRNVIYRAAMKNSKKTKGNEKINRL